MKFDIWEEGDKAGLGKKYFLLKWVVCYQNNSDYNHYRDVTLRPVDRVVAVCIECDQGCDGGVELA